MFSGENKLPGIVLRDGNIFAWAYSAVSYMSPFLSYFTARQRSCGKVMFSLVSVCLFQRWRVSPCDHCTWWIGSLCTVTPPPIPCYNPPRHETWESLAPPPAGDIWWPSLETCSNLFTWGPTPSGTGMLSCSNHCLTCVCGYHSGGSTLDEYVSKHKIVA